VKLVSVRHIKALLIARVTCLKRLNFVQVKVDSANAGQRAGGSMPTGLKMLKLRGECCFRQHVSC